METWKAELLYKSDMVLGESAHWHPAWRRFLFVDIESGEVGAIDPGTGDIKTWRLGKESGPSFLLWMAAWWLPCRGGSMHWMMQRAY